MDKDLLLLTLNEKWKCSLPFGWIPITGDDHVDNTEIYESDYFSYYIEEVKAIIQSIYHLQTLYQIREDSQLKDLSLEACDFAYDGLEYIYTDASCNFVLYISHENSTTI